MTLASLKDLVDKTIDYHTRVRQALNSGKRWQPAHQVKLQAQDVYVVRRVFLDDSTGDPVAAEWTTNLTWVEVIGVLATERAKGLEVWVP